MSLPNRPCPECMKNGHDKDGDHLFLAKDGKTWLCGRIMYHDNNQYYKVSAGPDGLPLNPDEKEERKEPPPPKEELEESSNTTKCASTTSSLFSKETNSKEQDHSKPCSEYESCSTYRGISGKAYDRFGCKMEKNSSGSIKKVFYPVKTKEGNTFWKIRKIPKIFSWDRKVIGTLKFFGQDKYSGEKHLLISEGQDDAVASDFMLGNSSRPKNLRVLCVSVPNGANTKSFRDNSEFLEKFDTVTYCPDQDEPGLAIVEEIALLDPSIKFMSLSEKDPCDMLKEGKEYEFIQAYEKAKRYSPTAIIGVAEVIESLRTPVATGLSYPWEGLTEITHGITPHSLVSIGGGPGSGKTSVVRAIQQHLMFHHKRRIGIFSIEESAEETLRYLVGYMMNKKIHVPGVKYDPEEAVEKAKLLKDKAFFYDSSHFHGKWSNIEKIIRFLYYDGVTEFFIDPVSALVGDLSASDGNNFINKIMASMRELRKNLPIYIMLVNHLNNPSSGKSHDEGGRVLPSQFTGSKGQWRYSTMMWGIERDLLNEDPEIRNTLRIRNLKVRIDGSLNGRTWESRYNIKTGRLEEVGSFKKTSSSTPLKENSIIGKAVSNIELPGTTYVNDLFK